MVLSKRERYVGIVTAAVLSILVLDRLILRRCWRAKSGSTPTIAVAEQERAKADQLFMKRNKANRSWRDDVRHRIAGQRRRRRREPDPQQCPAVGAGRGHEPGESSSRERTERDKEFDKITFRATGTGSMSQIGRFLYRIESASMPVRITDVLLSTRREGTDDLSITVGIATISLVPEAERQQAGGRTGAIQ